MRKVLRFAAGAMGSLMLLALAGCGKIKFEPQESGLYIDKNGSVISAEITSFDNSRFAEARYDAEELKTFVEDAVKAYNSSAGSPALAYAEELEDKKAVLPVAIQSLDVTEKEAMLLMDYVDCETYLKFNETDNTITDLELPSAPAAVASGISLDGFVNAEGEVVDTSKARESEKYKVAVITGETMVTVNGRIAGVSGAEILDEHTASAREGVVNYILFR